MQGFTNYSEYHDEEAILLATELDRLCKAIGFENSDYAVYVSDSALTAGIVVMAEDRSGVPGRAGNIISHTHIWHGERTVEDFFERYSFLVKTHNKEYFEAKCAFLEKKIEGEIKKTEELKKEDSETYSRLLKVEEKIGFWIFSPSKRNDSRLRGLGRSVKNYKKRNKK